MSTIITTIDRHSPAEKAGIQVGEQLLTCVARDSKDYT